MRKTHQNDEIDNMLDDDCPLCQLMLGRRLENGIEMELRGEFFVNRPLIEKVKREFMEAMKKTGVRPEIIYAFEKTGLFPSEDYLDRFSEGDLREWQESIEEYRNKNRESELF